MSPVCRIVVDDREPLDRIPPLLREAGFEVVERRLDHGDYSLPNGVALERKTVRGLNASLVRGTFWPQIGSLRRATRAPYLLIEGRDLHAGELPARSLIGALLAVIGQGIPVVWSSDPFRTADWIGVLAKRAAGRRPVRDRPAYAQSHGPPGTLVPEAVLAAVPGISTTRARALLAEFGTVAAIVAADEDALMAVPGIGETQAKRLLKAFH